MKLTALMEEESVRESLERTSVSMNELQAKQNSGGPGRTQDAMYSDEPCSGKSEDMEEGVDVGNALTREIKKIIYRQLTEANFGQSLQDSEELFFWVSWCRIRQVVG
jgi:hypothetical protein